MMFCVCHAEDITIQYNGSQAKVTQTKKDSVSVTIDGATVNVESLYESHKLTLLLKGSSDNGQFILKTKGKAKLTLDNLNLTSQEGAPLHLNNKKKVEIVAAKGSENTLTITACNDTANHKAATIWAKDKLLLSGKGTLNIIATGDGCRGIKSKKDITIEDLTLNVTTSGNMHQWGDGYPSETVIFSDMEKHGGYVIEEAGRILGYFAFLPSPEPTYSKIYDGEWLDDMQPYHVVHRIASYPDIHGIFNDIMDFCFSHDVNIRIDTHKDNQIMQHNIEKHGFTYCGIIYLANGDERLAYQRML